VPGRKRHPGGSRPRQDQEYFVNHSVVPFKLNGRITSNKNNKPHRYIPDEVFYYQARE
jgi:hypothetical protein